MLRSASELRHMALHATDGDLGRIEEFYFDDERWTIRYLVVRTGTWFSGRHVLIAPASVRSVDWAGHALHVALSRDQIRSSPPIDTDQPVSRRQEAEYLKHYDLPLYWGFGPVDGTLVLEAAARAAAARDEAAGTKPPTHLRSSKEVTGYRVEASDGPVGRIRDFVLDEGSWRIAYLAVEAAHWGGREVAMPPEWVERISWGDRTLFLGLAADAVRRSPAYETVMQLTPEYEAELERHYGRRRVWK